MEKIKINYLVDALMGLSFLVTALTGLAIFFFMPSGVRQGQYQVFLGLTKSVWASVHDWAGIIMVVLVLVHLLLHFNWIKCMTVNLFKK